MSESEPTIVEENQTISVSIQAIVDEEKGDGADMLDLIQNELNSRKKLKYRMEIPENPPIPILKERYSKLKFTDPTEAAIFIAKDSYNSFYPLNFEQGKKFRCPNCQFCMELVKTHENGQLFFIPVIKHEHRAKQCKPSNNIPK
ncbi:hypothetical protein TVAGG3_0372750, partial [Trichomonas vaginalis G3]